MNIRESIEQCAAALDAADVFFGHGTDNAYDEAAELVFFAAGRSHEYAPQAYDQTLTAQQSETVQKLLKRRIEERVPSAYLTHRMWFAGLEFYVDERVLVPRSPIAELIDARFAPWIDPHSVSRLLDIGTGSGCIAIASALAFPGSQVDAADVSDDALQVARSNVERYQLESRVHLLRSDVYSGLGANSYDIIVSNPPYVSDAEMAALPQEYLREPELGLRAGIDGLEVVRRILSGARKHLTAGGLLVVEVGDSEEALIDSYPRVPFTWLDFEHGGGGVFVLTAQQLDEFRNELES